MNERIITPDMVNAILAEHRRFASEYRRGREARRASGGARRIRRQRVKRALAPVN